MPSAAQRPIKHVRTWGKAGEKEKPLQPVHLFLVVCPGLPCHPPCHPPPPLTLRILHTHPLRPSPPPPHPHQTAPQNGRSDSPTTYLNSEAYYGIRKREKYNTNIICTVYTKQANKASLKGKMRVLWGHLVMALCPGIFHEGSEKASRSTPGFQSGLSIMGWSGGHTEEEEVVFLPRRARTLPLSFHTGKQGLSVVPPSGGATWMVWGSTSNKIENQCIFCFSSGAEFKHECNVLGKQTFQASCLNLSKERYLQIFQAGMNYPQCSKHFPFFLKANKHILKKIKIKINKSLPVWGVESCPVAVRGF